MCGIACFIGKKRKADFLIEKLEKLQYRGYDSAGLATLDEGKIEVYKQVGSISNLSHALPAGMETDCALSHTRWATNGEVNEINCHPHVSSSGVWAVVHNGIIENYMELKERLKVKPESQTDTAVVSQLLEETEVQTIDDFIGQVKRLEGSYALVASKSGEKKFFLAKKKSPLFVSVSEDNDFLVASDPVCFTDFSDKFYCLGDGEFAEISCGEIKFYDEFCHELKKQENDLKIFGNKLTENKYSTYMLKEIYEEADALAFQVNCYRETGILDKLNSKFFRNFKEIVFIGCGTAYHAGMIGAKLMRKLVGKNSRAEIASEFIYSEPQFVSKKTLLVLVSQSGETADTLKAMEIAKHHGATTLAITNVLYSTLASQADYVLPVCAGVEVAVASTKAYVCQISAIYFLAQNLRNENIKNKVDYFAEAIALSRQLFSFDEDKLNNLAAALAERNECILIGKDLDYITALEAALKLKETTYIPASAYPSGELKHGYLALVEKGTPVLVFAFNKKINQKSYNSAEEAKSRGAQVFIFTNDESMKNQPNVIFISSKNEFTATISAIVPLQLLACKICDKKNINPDKPKNLAKSVTVE